MSSKTNMKESFDVDIKNDAFYTGGKVRWSEDGTLLFCINSGTINVVDINLGRPKIALKEANVDENDEDVIGCIAITPSGSHVISAHKSGLFKYWQVSDGLLLKCWKTIHKGPVTDLDITSDGNILASGGSDSVIRLWNLVHHACTHALNGATGVISIVKFYEEENSTLLFGCGDDYKINCWDCKDGQLLFQLPGHYSRISDISFHHEKKYLVSCGRDKVVMLWDLDTKKNIKTLPVFESLEGIVCLPYKFELPSMGEVRGGVHVATAGEKGIVRVFELLTGKEIFKQDNSLVSKAEEGGLAISQLLYNDLSQCLGIITADHNIVLHELDSFKCKKQLIGFSDEILDVVFVGLDNSHLAVATNSSDIKLYSISNMGCQILKGHTDLVINLAVCFSDSKLMLSGAKDNTVRLWKFHSKSETMSCIFVGTRHTASVSAVCFSQMTNTFFLSASHDTTLKRWTVKTSKSKEKKKATEYDISISHTEVAHPKDINCICVSPNDQIVATASQDKTTKLWSVEDLTLVGVLKGHRRGVWSVRFSPVDKVVLTTSADCSLKLWSIDDLSCLKTLEGHESSVLRAEFLTKGMQILSTSGDGLLKLWNIKTSECIGTFDEHSGKVWALAVSVDESKIVTGGSDSLLIQWRDSTQEKRDAALKAREEMLAQEQLLSNLIQNNKLFAALTLSLSLEKPYKTLTIIKELYKNNQIEGLRSTVVKLTEHDKEKLIKCASTWNSNAKNCDAAQVVISVLLDELSSGQLRLPNLKSYIEELLPYTERHFRRLTGLLEDLHFLEYTVNCMKPTMKLT